MSVSLKSLEANQENIGAYLKNLEVNQESLNAILKCLETQIENLIPRLKEQSSRPLPDIEDKDIWEHERVLLSFDILGQPLVEKEKNNESVIEEESLLEKIQVEEGHTGIKIENVLVGIDKFNFPIDFVTLGMEED